LVEEDTLVTQIPLLANEALESSADLPNDAHLPPLYSASFGSNIKEQTNSDPISQLNINTTSKANRKTSITDRRNITNIPSIVTVNYDNAITGKQPSSSFHQMTPPYSALAAHHFDQELASSNNNPFENRMIELSEKSPIDTPQPTNPFIENNPPRSTNPFENASVIDPVNVTMGSPYQVQRQEEGRKDDIINSGLMSVSTTPISNVNSIGSSVEDTESPKSAKSPHKRLSNPFKRIMSRHGHKDDDNSGQLRVDPVPGLSRKASNRRNALHGPF
jgi:hypothetical protein